MHTHMPLHAAALHISLKIPKMETPWLMTGPGQIDLQHILWNKPPIAQKAACSCSHALLTCFHSSLGCTKPGMKETTEPKMTGSKATHLGSWGVTKKNE